MISYEKNQAFYFTIDKIMIMLMLPTIVTATSAVVISSDTLATKVISPAGQSIDISPTYTTNLPNFLANGAQWLIVAGKDSTLAGYTATFQTTFYSYCTVNTGYLQVRADDSFNAYLNNVLTLSGTNAVVLYSVNVSLGCGLNKMKNTVANGLGGNMALIFSITQEQTGCNNCCTDNIPLCVACQNAAYCNACQFSSLSLAADHSACINCSQYMPDCRTCSSTTYCTSCFTSFMFIASNHLACYLCIDYIPSCSTCTSQTYCLSCVSPTMFVSSDHTACHNCADYITNCTYCISQTFCTLCNSLSLFVSATHNQCLVCNQYIPDCFLCISETNCSFCKNSTLYLTSNSSLCLPCNYSLSNCLQCLSESVCFTCNNQTVLYMSSVCKHCGEIFLYCINCTDSSQCLECQSYTFLTDDHKECLLCRDYMQYCNQCYDSTNCSLCYIGQVVKGGCSKVIGCLEVNQISVAGILQAKCIKCDSKNFTLDSANHICVCKIGRLVGDYCTSDPGCVATQLIDGNVGCISCNLAENFILINTTHHCHCISGYFLSQNVCSEVCGDGKIFTSECDDGNSNDGDGCSHICKIEQGYKCSFSGSGPSVCKLISNQLKIQLISIKRQGTNKAIFTFDFFSRLSQLTKFNISDYFSFACCETAIDKVQWQIEDGKVKAIVDYSEDLQGKIGAVNFTFNKLYIHHEPIILQFLMHSKTLPLLFQEETTTINILNYMFFGISVLSLFLLLFGSWTHKMIGVEIIHPLQMIYYIHFAFKSYTLSVSSMQYLSLVGLVSNDIFWSNSKLNVAFFENFQKKDLQIDYSEFTLIIFSFPVLLSVICLIINFFIPSKSSLHRLQSQTTNIMKKVYQGLIFPTVLGFIFTYFLIAATFTTRSNSSNDFLSLQLKIFIMIITMIFNSSILQNQFKFLMTWKIQKRSLFYFEQAKIYYIPIYELNSFTQLIVLWLWIRQGYSWGIFVLFGMALLTLIFQLIFRPYKAMLDNIGICSNSVLLILFFLFFWLRDNRIYQVTTQIDAIFCLIIAILGLLCVILSFARVARTIWCSNQENAQKNAKQRNQNQDLEQDQITLKKMIEIYAAEIPSQRLNLLDQNNQLKPDKFTQAHSNNEKRSPQLMRAVEKQIKQRKKRKQKKLTQQDRGVL